MHRTPPLRRDDVSAENPFSALSGLDDANTGPANITGRSTVRANLPRDSTGRFLPRTDETPTQAASGGAALQDASNSTPLMFNRDGNWRTGPVYQESARRHSAEVLSTNPVYTAEHRETAPNIQLPVAESNPRLQSEPSTDQLVLQAILRIEEAQKELVQNQNSMDSRIRNIETRNSQRSSVVARLEASAARNEATSRMSNLNIRDTVPQPLPSQDARNAPSAPSNRAIVRPEAQRNSDWYASNRRGNTHLPAHNRANRHNVAGEDNRIVTGRDPFNTAGETTAPEALSGGSGGNLPPSGPRVRYESEDDLPRQQSEDRRYSSQSRDDPSSSKLPRLKPQDIGYWDPRGKAKDDHKDKPMKVSVEMFIRRLERLAIRHGEQAIVDNLEPALVHVTSWLGTLSNQDLRRSLTLEGWFYLLRRDFGESEVLSRQKAKDYDYTVAEDAMDYWTEKLALLRQAGYQQEQDLYYEIWFGLPRVWKENIPMHGTLDGLRTIIREKEVARGRWPTKSKPNERSDSADSGYSSTPRNSSSKKRGGGFSGGGGKRAKDSDGKNIPSCRICERQGKPDQKHWHADCPNAENKKLSTVAEEEEESVSSEDNSSQESDQSGDETISHVYSKATISAVKDNTFQPITFPHPKIFRADVNKELAKQYGPGNLFRASGAVMIYVRSTPTAPDVRICCDSGCGPTIGNRAFVMKTFPEATVMRRESDTPLRVTAGFQRKEYEVLPDYVSVPLYMVTTHGNLLELNVEIHLCESHVEANILLGSSALKYNRIKADFDKEILVAADASTNRGQIKVPMYLNERRNRIDSKPVKAKKDMVIPPGHEALVPVDLSDLPERDFMYEGKEWFSRNGLFGKSPRAVANSNVTRVVVANFGEDNLKISAGETVGSVSDFSSKVDIENLTGLNTSRSYLGEPDSKTADFA